MSYNTKSVEGIIITSYITKYNINVIKNSFLYDTVDDFFGDYMSLKNTEEDGEFVSHKHLYDAIEDMKECIDMLKYYDIQCVNCFSDDYPEILRNTRKFPPILYVKGQLRKTKNIAIIGTREVSDYASGTIDKYVKMFAEKGYGIVSGLALGVDTLAHTFAIDKNAYTIAVLSSPLNTIYPKENYGLAANILSSGGALVSELPMKISRGRNGFIERNRIITGISEYVSPIEMGLKSGTMSAVNAGFSQNKKVLLIEPENRMKRMKQYEGINYLIENQKKDKNSNVTILKDSFTWSDIESNHFGQISLF